MFKRCLVMVAAVALLVFAHTTTAEARRFSRGRVLRPRTHHVRSMHAKSPTTSFQRVRQIDGRSLWDLGKQNGQWPAIRF